MTTPIDMVELRANALYTNHMRARKIRAMTLAPHQVDPVARRVLMAQVQADIPPFESLSDDERAYWRGRSLNIENKRRRRTDPT